MTKDVGVLRIDKDLHRQVRATAALDCSPTIRAWVEQVLRNAIRDRARVLIDTKAEYVTKGENHHA